MLDSNDLELFCEWCTVLLKLHALSCFQNNVF